MKKPSLTIQISAALLLGVAVGVVLQNSPQIAQRYILPVGTVYLNLIKMIVVPVVALSVIQGVISLQDVRKVGALGGRTMAFFLCSTALAVTAGLLVANVLGVGKGFSMPATSPSEPAATTPDLAQTFVNIFPENMLSPFVQGAMLQVIVVALFVGFGILLAGEKGATAAAVVDSFSRVSICIMDSILKVSAVGVFALIVPVVAQQGAKVLLPLLGLAGTAYLAYLIHVVAVYGTAVAVFARIRPGKFFRTMIKPALFAFSSASSVGTLPFNMEATRQLGVKQEVSGFVLPLGATVNMDGTAIYQGVCVMFIARIFGVELSLSQQLTVVLTAVLASIGTAGVPGSGMVMLAMVLESVGLPVSGMALVAGIDRILDMGRTVVNITGDSACCVCVDAWSRRKKKKNPPAG